MLAEFEYFCITIRLMLKNPKSSAFLILSSSNLDSKEITNILNIQPDFYNTVEENGTPKTIWQLNSNLSPDDDIESHIVALLKKIAPVRTGPRTPPPDRYRTCSGGHAAGLAQFGPHPDR